MRVYDKIKHADACDNSGAKLLYIQEKIDGANGSFYKDDTSGIVFTSRTRVINPDKAGMFKKSIDYLRDTIDIKSLVNGYIYYGEYGIQHTLVYNNLPPFIGFDIYDQFTGRYLDANDAKIIFASLGIDFVPTLEVIDGSRVDTLTSHVPSKFKIGEAEGIVIKNYDMPQQFSKMVADDFKESNGKIFGLSKRAAKDDNELLVATYCTDARIHKHIYNYLDDGVGLDMKLMVTLPTAVWQDIIDEHAQEILRSNMHLDLRRVKKLVAHRCVEVLKLFISRNGDYHEMR